MASCSRKRSVVTLEKKLEVIALLKDSFQCYGYIQNYGHHFVPCCPDKWSWTVPTYICDVHVNSCIAGRFLLSHLYYICMTGRWCV